MAYATDVVIVEPCEAPHTAVELIAVPLGEGPTTPGSHHRLEWYVEELQVVTSDVKAPKTILRNIRGEATSGTFTALLGPSGAGKTSLLECISMRNRNFRGAVAWNGAQIGSGYYGLTALVPQHELLFGYLTPREHLTFHASAKMGKSPKAVQQRVNEVLRECHLDLAADTIIGGNDALFAAKGLSGGERKRLNLATELLQCPSVIFLDEPTSGLDSVMAASVVQTLSELAGKGHIVIASLHCPASDTIQLLTHVLLLTQHGRVAFHGPREQAVPYLVSLGYPPKKDYNSADFMLETVSRPCRMGAVPADFDKQEKARMDRLAQSFETSAFNVHAQSLVGRDMSTVARGAQTVRCGPLRLFANNLRRWFMWSYREWPLLSLMVAVLMFTGLLLGALFFQTGSKQWRNTLGLNYTLACSEVILLSTSMCVLIPLMQPVLQRECLTGVNTPGSYLLAQVISQWPVIIGPAFQATLIYFMTGMNLGFWGFLQYVGTVVLTCLCSIELGIFVSSLHSHILVCLAMLPGLITPMIMFSGLIYQRSLVPAWLRWIGDVSIVNHSFTALQIITSKPFSPAESKMVMDFLEINPNGLHYSIGMLAMMTVGLGFLGYIMLKMRFTMSSVVM